MKTASRLFVAVMVVGGPLTCTQAPPNGGNGGNGNGSGVEIPETTKVLSASTLERLQSVSNDLSLFTFDGTGGPLAEIEEGDIIVSDVFEPLLPYGTLRRVTSVSTDNSLILVTTEEASLAQAVEQGSLHARIPLTAEGANLDAKSIPRMQGPGQLVFPLVDVVLFDCDGDEGTDHDRVLLNGTLTLDPEIVIDFDFAGFALERAAVEVVGTATATVTIESHCDKSFQFEELLQSVPFPKVVIPIGVVPVVLVPILEIRGGAEGAFSNGLETNLTLNADMAVGLEYEGSPAPVFEVDPAGSVSVPSFDKAATADGKVWIGARFKVGVYGLAGLYAESQFFGRVHVNAAECPWWELFGGVLGKAGAFLEISVGVAGVGIIDITVIDWDTPALTEEVLLADAGECVPPEPVDVPTWARTIGNASIDFPVSAALAPNGGTVIGGGTYSYTPGTLHPDATLFRVDQLGNIAWQVGYDDLVAALSVQSIPGGYYMLAGEVSELDEDPSYLLRLDLNGVPVWAKALSHASRPLDAVSLAVLPGGDVIVAGNIDDYQTADIWIARFDTNGNLQWSQTMGGPEHDHVKSMIVDSAGDIVVLAESNSYAASSEFGCYWTLKLSDAGATRWQNCYNGPHVDFAGEVVEVPGGYVLIGDFAEDVELNRIDGDGSLILARHFDADTLYDKGFSAAALPDGTVVIAGRRNLGADADIWAFRIDEEANVLWSRGYGGSQNDEAGGFNQYASLGLVVLAVPNGGILLAGHTESFGAGSLDTWLLKIRDVGTIDFAAGSGATAAAVQGLALDASHDVTQANATPESVDLIVSDYTVHHYSTNFQVSTQSELP